MFTDKRADGWVVVGPVRHHVGDPRVFKGTRHVIGEQHCLLVRKAGNAPVGGHIDKHWGALSPQRLQSLG